MKKIRLFLGYFFFILNALGGIAHGQKAALYQDGALVMQNSIVYLNMSAYPSTISGATTNIPYDPVNKNLQDVNPLFTSANNYLLQTTSPARDAGTNSFNPILDDIKGNGRLQNGNVDQGAFEFGAAELPCIVTFASPTKGAFVVKNGATVVKSGDILPKNTVLTVTATPDSRCWVTGLTANALPVIPILPISPGAPVLFNAITVTRSTNIAASFADVTARSVVSQDKGTLTLQNSIVNTNVAVDLVMLTNDPINFTVSAANNNLPFATNPLFTSANNYLLLTTSPAKDAGANSFNPLLDDIKGNFRSQNINVDQGAFEFGLAYATRVSFNANGGAMPNPSAISVVDNATYGTLPTTTWQYHSFDGWFTAATDGTQVLPTTIKVTTAAHTLYAHWTVVPNTVSFNANTGVGAMPDQSIGINQSAYLVPNTFTKEGYAFAGWSTVADGSGTQYGNTASYAMGPDSGYMLYAQWKFVPTQSTICQDGGTITLQNSIVYQNAVGYAPTVPVSTTNITIEASHKDLMNTDPLFTSVNNYLLLTTSPAKDAGINSFNPLYDDIKGNVRAQKTSIDLGAFEFGLASATRVSFNANGGIMPNPSAISVVDDTPYGTLPTISWQYHSFDGWFTAASGGTQIFPTTTKVITTAHTLYAHWTVTPNTVSFDANTGVGTMLDQSIGINQSDYLSPNTFTKEGYAFAGWNTVADGSGTQYGNTADYAMGPDSGYMLYAQWKFIPTQSAICQDGGSITLQNSIVYLNANGYAPTVPVSTTNITIEASHKDLMNVDPLFTSVNNYSLLTTSPAKDAGTNLFNPLYDDIKGNGRFQNDTIDQGAFEFGSGSIFTSTIKGGMSPICYATSPGTFTASGTGGVLSYVWFKNGLSTGVTTNTYSPDALTETSVFYCAVTIGGRVTLNTEEKIITVNLNTVESGSLTPTLRVSSVLTDVTHKTTGATGIGTPINLPPGVTAKWEKNSITINGIPTKPGVFNYSVPLVGGCGAVNATGTITVTPSRIDKDIICN